MNSQTIIQKSEKGWIIELPDEFAESIGVERNSIGLLGYKNGKIEVEFCRRRRLNWRNLLTVSPKNTKIIF